MQRRGSSSGNVAKWASGLPCVGMVQTFRALAAVGSSALMRIHPSGSMMPLGQVFLGTDLYQP